MVEAAGDVQAGDAEAEGDVVALLQQLIRNRCVNEGTLASGHELRSADVLQQYLEGGGLDVERLSHPDAPHRANLVVRIEGRDPTAPTLGLLGHMDVVPVSPEGWTRDPFGGELVDGEVWGRGAVDMLNQTAAMAVAVRRLADRGWRPRGTLVYQALADEEGGSLVGAKWLTEEHLDVVQADYVITEVGGAVGHGRHGLHVEVSTGEKGGVVANLHFAGTPSHGSTPWGADNALLKAAVAVQRIHAFRPPTRINETWRTWVLGQGYDADTEAILLDAEGLWDALPQLSRGLAARAHACTHSSFSPNVVTGGTKRNIVPDHVVVQLDTRLVLGDDPEWAIATLQSLVGDLDGTVEVIRQGEPTQSPVATPLWEAMERAADRVLPGVRLLASPLTGGTDARFYRRMGVPAYGFGLLSPRLTPARYWSMFHGHDERIDVESLRLSEAMWEELLVDFLG